MFPPEMSGTKIEAGIYTFCQLTHGRHRISIPTVGELPRPCSCFRVRKVQEPAAHVNARCSPCWVRGRNEYAHRVRDWCLDGSSLAGSQLEYPVRYAGWAHSCRSTIPHWPC